MRCSIIDASGRISERWSDFADAIGQVYTTRRSHRGGGRAMYSAADLADIILRLKRFMRADGARCDRVATVASPIVPHASVRVAYATPAAVDTPVATPPPLAPAPITRDDLAAAVAASHAAVLSVLRAHGSGGAPTITPPPLPRRLGWGPSSQVSPQPLPRRRGAPGLRRSRPRLGGRRYRGGAGWPSRWSLRWPSTRGPG